MVIIGISGKRGSGKDKAADFMQSFTVERFERVKFADKLKEIASTLSCEPLDTFLTQEGKSKFLPAWNMTAGEFLQRLGTDAVRDNLHTDAWVISLLSGLKPDQDYIITDVRFPNEADAIRAKGGIMLRINGNPVGLQGDGKRDDNHASETALDNYQFDYVIENDGSLKSYETKICMFLRKIVYPSYVSCLQVSVAN